MTKKIFPVLLITLLLLTITSTAAKKRQSVLAEFMLSPELCNELAERALYDPIHLQVVVLNLSKGYVYFHSDYDLQLRSKQGKKPDCTYKELFTLDRGEYLFEFLFYDTLKDRFEVRIMGLKVEKNKRYSQLKIFSHVDALSHKHFKRHRKTFIYNPSRPNTVFYDHMLWLTIQHQAKRSPELWDDLFTRIKIQSTDINYSALGRMQLNQRYSNWDADYWDRYLGRWPSSRTIRFREDNRTRLAFAVTEKLFQIAVRTDNAAYLTSKWVNEGFHNVKEERSLLKNIRKEAKQVYTYCRFLYVDEILERDFDKKAFDRTFTSLSAGEKKQKLHKLVQDLEEEVEDVFYGGKTTSVNFLSSDTPLILAQKIERAAKIIRKSIK